MSEEHSLLAPSSADRWVECPGSLVLCADSEQAETEYTLEGTIAHALAKACFDKNCNAEDVAEVLVDDVLRPIPDDMIEPVNTYLSTVRSMTAGAKWTASEERLDLSGVYGVADQGGTGDFLALMPDGEVQAHDLKYGKGIRVFAANNRQTRIYGCGAMKVAELFGPVTGLRTVIHQPRISAEPSEEVLNLDEVHAFKEEIAAKAKYAADLFELGTASPSDFSPGEKQCQWCLEKATCPYLAAAVTKTVADDFDDLTAVNAGPIIESAAQAIKDAPAPGDGSAAIMSGKLKMIPLIRMFIKAVESRAMRDLLNGVEYPDFKLVLNRGGNRKWDDAAEVENILKAMRLKKEQMYNLSVISPAQAEKILGKGKRKWSKLEKHITRADPSPTIVEKDDPRETYTPKPIGDDFSDLTSEDDFSDLV